MSFKHMFCFNSEINNTELLVSIQIAPFKSWLPQSFRSCDIPQPRQRAREIQATQNFFSEMYLYLLLTWGSTGQRKIRHRSEHCMLTEASFPSRCTGVPHTEIPIAGCPIQTFPNLVKATKNPSCSHKKTSSARNCRNSQKENLLPGPLERTD